MRFSRKLIACMGIVALMLLLIGPGVGPAAARTTFVSIGTGGTGGIYYPYGGGVAEIWSKYVKGVKAVAEVTGASVENVKLAHKGETVIGEVMGDVAVAGYSGLSKFKGKKHNILAMAIMYPNLLQVVTLKKSGITNIEQVKGRSISTGSPGSGTNFMSEAVLKALGIPLNSFKDRRLSFTESANANDIHGHGTHIAGIITANSENSLGIVGLATESLLLNVKIADDKGRCRPSALAEGIIWAVDNGANVINISIEIKESSSQLREAVDYAWTNGAVIIAAAGNDGDEIPVYPACYENCIGVTAIRENGTMAPLANCGDWVDVAAPGDCIYSTWLDNQCEVISGTSSAAALVSGVAALVFSVAEDSNGNGVANDEVRWAIENSCIPIAVDGVGQGLVNAFQAVTKTIS